MATTPAAVSGEYGVSLELSGYTIESFTRTDQPQREKVPDQYNATAKEVRYDTVHNISVTMRGAAKPGFASFTFDGKNYIVDSVEDAGTYNGLYRFTVQGHYSTNCTAETLVGGESSGNS